MITHKIYIIRTPGICLWEIPGVSLLSLFLIDDFSHCAMGQAEVHSQFLN